MVRPQVSVNISGAAPSPSIATATGTLFLVYAGPTGPTTPTKVTSSEKAADAGVPDALATWIGDALAQGVADVIVVRADAEDASAVTGAEWSAALDAITPSYGPGQVTIPGVDESAAHAALLAHVAANPERVAFLDVAEDAEAGDIATTATSISASEGAERAALFAPWVLVPGVGSPRAVPASIIAAGLAARGDAAVGHANNAPIFDQSRGAGAVLMGLGVAQPFTDTEVDDLYDAGVDVFRLENGVTTLTGWRSLAADGVWRQLNIGRLTTEVSARVGALMYQYLGSPLDGQGILFSQISGDITGYLLGLYAAGGLYGATADDAFSVTCDFTNNTAETIAAGEVHAHVEIAASTHAERITINIVTSLAG